MTAAQAALGPLRVSHSCLARQRPRPRRRPLSASRPGSRHPSGRPPLTQSLGDGRSDFKMATTARRLRPPGGSSGSCSPGGRLPALRMRDGESPPQHTHTLCPRPGGRRSRWNAELARCGNGRTPSWERPLSSVKFLPKKGAPISSRMPPLKGVRGSCQIPSPPVPGQCHVPWMKQPGGATRYRCAPPPPARSPFSSPDPAPGRHRKASGRLRRWGKG